MTFPESKSTATTLWKEDGAEETQVAASSTRWVGTQRDGGRGPWQLGDAGQSEETEAFGE